ncbi:MAG TPA: IS982 family transposase [Thermoanaerobaculales bacterium]|nr:IS982 family transposase [Thermoanaerobaculales bacterium]
MDTDLDTLVTALYVMTDDLLRAHPERVPARPKGSFAPRTSDAELLTLAVMQALLGYPSERHCLRYAHRYLRPLFPGLPLQPGYNKRLRKLGHTMAWLIGQLARQTSVATDDVWVVDSTPVECARSRETVKRSDLAGWAEYGYCASHSRYFWGLRLHLVCTVHGLPIAWALTSAKADERQVLTALLESTEGLHQHQHDAIHLLLADKNYYGKTFEAELDENRFGLLRKARKGEKPRPGGEFFKPLRQIVESVFDTFKGQLDLEDHHGKTPAGVATRITQRILALTAVIWHNDRAGAPVLRSLTAYDH